MKSHVFAERILYARATLLLDQLTGERAARILSLSPKFHDVLRWRIPGAKIRVEDVRAAANQIL